MPAKLAAKCTSGNILCTFSPLIDCESDNGSLCPNRYINDVFVRNFSIPNISLGVHEETGKLLGTCTLALLATPLPHPSRYGKLSFERRFFFFSKFINWGHTSTMPPPRETATKLYSLETHHLEKLFNRDIAQSELLHLVLY